MDKFGAMESTELVYLKFLVFQAKTKMKYEFGV